MGGFNEGRISTNGRLDHAAGSSYAGAHAQTGGIYGGTVKIGVLTDSGLQHFGIRATDAETLATNVLSQLEGALLVRQ